MKLKAQSSQAKVMVGAEEAPAQDSSEDEAGLVPSAGVADTSGKRGRPKKEQKSKLKDGFIKDNIKYTCANCKLVFLHKGNFLRHQRRHDPPGGFVCKFCNSAFTTDILRANHRKEVHSVYKCRLCESVFKSDEEYIEHINIAHQGKDREYEVCTECGQQFKSAIQLKIHNETKCGTEKSFECEICGSKYLTAAALNYHVQIHSGEKKHLCNYCGTSFLSKGQLKVHTRSHTKEKPFKCEVCNKAFPYRESLVTHSSVHTGIKPYFCDSCSKTFSCIGNLIKHRRSRPDTCGQERYSRVNKIAPRPCAKNMPSLKLKNKIPKSLKSTSVKSPEKVTEKTKDEMVDSKLNYLTGTVGSLHRMEDHATSNEENIKIEFVTWTEQQDETMEHTTDKLKETPSTSKCRPIETEILNTLGPDINEKIDKAFASQQDESIEFITAEVDPDFAGGNSPVKESALSIVDECSNDVSYEKTNDNDNYNVNDHDYDDYGDENDGGDDDFDKNVSLTIEIVHDDKIEYDCKLCPQKYGSLQWIIKHIESVHEITNDTESYFAEIKPPDVSTKVSKSKSFACQYCNKLYAKITNQVKHEKLHGKDGSLLHKCTCCSNYFKSLEESSQHAVEYHKDKLECKTCNKIYKDPDNLAAHVRYTHSEVKPVKYIFVCIKCGRNFSSKIALSDHERSNCGQSKLYNCKTCGKNYNSAGTLKTHKTIHTGVLPFVCNHCGKGFRTQGQLKVHERSHTGNKPYQCEFCAKEFAHRESLLTHRSLHTGVKRFMCTGCDLRFSCISNLQAHRRSHKLCAEKPINTKPIGPMEAASAKVKL